MSCYHPLKAWPIGLNPSGKTAYKITSYEVDHLERDVNGHYYPVSHTFGRLWPGSVCSFVEIPCGRCIGCRLAHSRDWANRCLLELEYHSDAWFLTLTYSDDYVPRAWYSDPDTGEAFQALTLDKEDLQKFWKRLRKNTGQQIRYFACGEYGAKTLRPHYHAIVFGLHLDDVVPWTRNPLGQQYYLSQTIQDCWSVRRDCHSLPVPIGNILVAPVTWETCAYVARYTLKKCTGLDREFFEFHNMTPSYVVMSRRPGIARQWYEDHPDLYDVEYINIKTPKGGRKIRPPKYYDRLFDIDEPERMAEIKAIRRHMADEMKKAKARQTDLDYLEELAIEERKAEGSVKKLKRRLDDET